MDHDDGDKENGKIETPHEEQQDPPITPLDILRILTGLLLLSALLSYAITGTFLWNYKPWWSRPSALISALRGPLILTDDELSLYSGTNESLPIYLALNGTIYDVSAGRRIYGPGGPYHFFAGRDATRGFVTGCFKEDSVADWRGVEWTFVPKDVARFSEKRDEELGSEQEKLYRYEMVDKALKDIDGTIEHWAKVFRGETGKDYFEVGFVRRDSGWMERLPLRALCESAEKKRPKGQFDEGKVYQRPRDMRRVRAAKRQQLDDQKAANPVIETKRDEL